MSAVAIPHPAPPVRELPLEHLEHQITQLAAHIYAATCRWLELVAEFDRRRGWAEWGCRSCAHWISWRCSVAPSAAREQVRVAQSIQRLGLVREAFARGELSYSKVRAITRVAGEGTEAALVELARHSTAAQLEKLVRAYRGVASADVETANASHARRFLSWRWEDDGSLTFRGRLSAEDGAALVAAVEAEVVAEAQAAAIEAGASAEVPPGFAAVGGSPDEEAAEAAEQPEHAGRGARAADALSRLVDAARSARAGVRESRSLPQVLLHVDVDTLGGEDIADRCEIEDGPAVAPETARRLCCDASVVRVHERDGEVLDVGRRTRTIHPALRRALECRDGGCVWPGCGRDRRLHAHHIVHWARGGRTDRDNLVLLCPFHHRLVHEGGFDVARVATGLEFTRPDGTPIAALPPVLEGVAVEVEKVAGMAGAAVDERTCVPRWFGEPLDVHYAVSLLCDRSG